MRTWMWRGVPPATQVGDVYFNVTPAYTELFLPASYYLAPNDGDMSKLDRLYLVFYAHEIEPNRWLVLNSYEDYFAVWFSFYNDPQIGGGFRKAIAESCPLLLTLMERGPDLLRHDFALRRMNDVDHNREIVVLTAIFGNTVIGTIDRFFEGKPLEVYRNMIGLNLALVRETHLGPLAVPNVFEYVGAQAKRDEREKMKRKAAEFAKTWAPELFKLILGV